MLASGVVRIAMMVAGVAAMQALAGPAQALDGQPTPNVEMSPMEAFRSGTQALQAGENDKAVTSLQYAAEKGYAVAQWKLGRMYELGDGVPQDDIKAFRYFSTIANMHAEDSPFLPEARFVSSAFVSLGRYYLIGIPNSNVRANADRAREMFRYAASYFGDADAQYHLGRIYHEGRGTPKDPRQAARWLRLAAIKGQPQAQALLGSIFFDGNSQVPRQAARGLMWLMLAHDAASPETGWISETYTSALKRATDDERALALVYLESYMKNRRD
ncbi:MAG TPA: tetratricopeptide repeat protein [Xanthobacteraceae bacterium]|nr:tetratricopeptide repeat protein [Xanthobacteraceae bacterium]